MKTKGKLLFSSVIAIIFCLSLMIGATFALFTSESKVNVAVSSGKVSVVANAENLELYSGVWNDTTKVYDSVKQTNGNFINGGNASIVENTVTVNLLTSMDKVAFDIVIRNYSNVKVLYQTKVELVDGLDLFKGLEITIGEGANAVKYDGMTAYSNWASLEPVVDADGNYDEANNIVVPVSIELPEKAGNEYQDLTCTLAYTVSAVQGNAHVEDPVVDPNLLSVHNLTDFKLFAESVANGNNFSGKTVQLGGDIDLNNEEWTPIDNFNGTFDGNGHTISNLNVNQPNRDAVGLFGYIDRANFKNLTIENANVVGDGCVGALCGYAFVCNFDNITIKGDVKVEGVWDVAGVTGYTYGDVTNVTIDANDGSIIKAITSSGSANAAGVVGFLGEGSGSISNVTSNIDVYGTSYGVGGIVGMAQYGTIISNAKSSGNVSIYDESCAYATTIKRIGGIAGDWMNSNGSVVTLENVSFTGTLSAKSADGVVFTDFYNQGLAGRCWNNGPGGILVLNGVAYQWLNDGMYAILDQASTISTIATSNKITHYEIYNEKGLQFLATEVNDNKKTYKGEVIKLTNNINLADINWTPIGLNGDVAGFQGIFDGQNKTISNLTVDLTSTPKFQSAGLFGAIINAEVKNFTVENAKVHNLTTGSASACGTAVVAGSSAYASTIKNVHVIGAELSSNRMVGGIAGYFVGTVDGCTVTGIKLTATPDKFSGSYDNGDKVGGIIATTNGVTNLTNNKVTDATLVGYRDLGGIAGAANCGTVSGNTVEKISITSDQQKNHYEFIANNAQAIVGRVLAGTVGNNTTKEIDVTIVKITSGLYTEDPTAYLAEGYTTVKSGNKFLVVEKTADDSLVLEAETDEALSAAKGVANAEITLGTGEFSTISGVADGVTITGAEDGSTVVNHTAGSGALTSSYKNTTITNVTFAGSNAARWTYNTGDSVFNNCTFKGKTYGFHVDSANGGTITFNNCTFIGFNAFAGDGTYYFNNCTFKHSGSYGHTNMWGVGYFNNCTFEENVTWASATDAIVYMDGKAWVGSTANLTKVLFADQENIHVVLNDDLSLDVSDSSIALGTAKTKSIVIDGDNYNLTLTTSYWSRLSLANPEATLTLKNMTLTSTQTSGTWDSYDVTFKCNVELENVVLEKALAIDGPGKTAKLTNVKINETHDYYALWIVAGSNVVIDGLEVTSSGRGIKIDAEYVDNPTKTTLKISNAKFTTVKKAAIMVDSPAGADITCENINIENCTADSKNVVWVDSDAASYYDLVTVTGATKFQEQ